MHRLHQRRTQDCTIPLDWLVTASEDHLVDVWAWQLEDMACKKVWDWCKEVQNWVDLEFWGKLLALEWVEVLWEQNVILARAVQATDDDCLALDTVLALVIAFMLPASQPLTVALPVPWESPATQQQAPLWTWEEGPVLPPAARNPWPRSHLKSPANQPPDLGSGPPFAPDSCGHGVGTACSGARTAHWPCWPWTPAARGGAACTRGLPAAISSG
ncbi:hypothetical protein Y1Q_0017629 [Alligator mississippiensis]|uniref:Uncharacterized protein n=1 Tax=Alligator mississippiensis TaxID=8496 RepID=A0A151P2P9_ALLMI|nr:hypothetical protein Y1Q_0017629 [Alligator mississippiensis]